MVSLRQLRRLGGVMVCGVMVCGVMLLSGGAALAQGQPTLDEGDFTKLLDAKSKKALDDAKTTDTTACPAELSAEECAKLKQTIKRTQQQGDQARDKLNRELTF